MKTRFVAVASAATAILFLSACGNDDDDSPTTTDDSPTTTSEAPDAGPTILAKGEDIELVGTEHLEGRTLNIDAKEEDGVVTGEFWLDDNVITIECADTDTDGVVILGGEATAGPDVNGELYALIIREGDPDSVSFAANDGGAGSCTELVESIPHAYLTDDSLFAVLEDGYDIKTG